ncbi:MAG: hypothetical protein GF390_02840 [Candidatus Pacebacteria bacterium]|nr:hypothetical protein [Candidatus Paceibacterota bacterium]
MKKTFNKLVEIHELHDQGNHEEARQLREELGWGKGPGPRRLRQQERQE